MNKTALILFQILCLTVFVSARTGLVRFLHLIPHTYHDQINEMHFQQIFIISASRETRDAADDINETFDNAEKELQGFVKQFWGGKCVTDDQCMKYVSYCDKNAGVSQQFLGSLAVDGECRPNIWIWLVLAGIVLLFLGACICCICCGLCKCLYK